MRVFPIIKKVVVVEGGGDLQPGASVISDEIRLFARVTLPDEIPGQSDQAAFAIAATYAETGLVPSEALSLGVRVEDAVAGQSESTAVKVLIPDALATALEALGISVIGFVESVAAQTESLKAGVAGYLDTQNTPSEALLPTSQTWATSHSTAGTAPTNPTNAYGQNNGTLARCKAAGLPTVVASTLTLTIPRASVPDVGTLMFRAYYITNAGVADTFTLTYAQTGGNPGTIDLPDGNFLTNPHETAITGLHATNPITVAFTHNCTVAATGGSIDVDAVAIRSVGAFA